MKDKITIVHKVLFTEAIINYFCETIEGVYADLAYYELLVEVEKYLKKPNRNFENHIEFNFNIKKKDLTKIKQDYRKQLKEIKKYGIFKRS